MKLIKLLCVFISTISVFKLSNYIFKSEKIAYISSLIYVASPYLFSDIFLRDSFAEIFMFPLLPLIFLGFTMILEENSKNGVLIFIISYTLGMYSHLISMVYITIFLLLYLLMNIKKINKEKFKSLTISTLIVVGLVFPILVSMLEMRGKGNYLVFTDNFMTSVETMKYHAIPFEKLFVPDINVANIYTYISPIVWISLGVTCIKFKEIKNKIDINKRFICFFILIVLSIFMMSKFMPWEYMPEFMLMIQFPWRLNVIAMLFLSLISPLWLLTISNSNENYILFGLLILLSIFNRSTPNLFKTFDETIQNMKVVGIDVAVEYLPVNAYQNISELLNDRNMIYTDNELVISNIKNNIDSIEFQVKNVEKSSEISFRRLYYPGYKLYFIDSNENIEIMMNDIGLISAVIYDEGDYKLIYEGTKFMKVSYYVSTLSLIIFIVYVRKRKDIN